MSSPAPPSQAAPAHDLGTWFGLIIDGLCRAVAAQKPWSPKAISRYLLWQHLRRLAHRFQALVAQVQAGGSAPPRRAPRRTPRHRPETPEGQEPAEPPKPHRVRLPQGYAWLNRLVPYQAAGFGSQLQNFLSQPETVALLAASPQAVRLLRPLCRMLAAHPTPPLPPLPARAPRKSRRKPPPEPDPEPDSELRRVARSHWTSVCPPGRVRGSPWPSPGLGSFRLPPRHLRRD